MTRTRPRMPPGPEGATAQMLTTLVRLRDALQGVRLPLELPDVAERRGQRTEVVDQLEDYVLPRLVQIDAPLLAVVGGSTGAGKSTLVNSLVGSRVTTPGVLRPTTRSPVLVHNHHDAEWFGQDRILPGLTRTTRPTNDPEALQLVATSTLPPGLAVLDAPDVDSIERANRDLAAELLAAADLWLFVTTAARYADQVPWDYLRQAADRSAAVAIVLDRTPPAAVTDVSSHLARMLTARGLRDSPLFVVREVDVDADGLLPPETVGEIKTWLGALAADGEARGRVVRQTLEGAIRVLARSSHQVADAATEQVAIRGRLLRDVEQAYADAADAIDRGCADGTLLRGEVLARWQEFVGTGEFFKGLEAKVGWLRDRIGHAVRGQPQQAGRVSVAVESGLQTLILENAEDAAERAATAWHAHPAGRALLDVTGRGGADAADAGDLGRASRDFRTRADRAVRDWQQEVLDLVRREGADKRSTARFLAYGVNGLGVALMVVVFASTAGITGAEVGIAGGSALLGQKLLEAVFGDQAVRRLAQRAREDLAQRVQALLESEQRRFLDRLDALAISVEAPEQVRELARQVDDLRFAQRSAERPDPDAAGARHRHLTEDELADPEPPAAEQPDPDAAGARHLADSQPTDPDPAAAGPFVPGRRRAT